VIKRISQKSTTRSLPAGTERARSSCPANCAKGGEMPFLPKGGKLGRKRMVSSRSPLEDKRHRPERDAHLTLGHQCTVKMILARDLKKTGRKSKLQNEQKKSLARAHLDIDKGRIAKDSCQNAGRGAHAAQEIQEKGLNGMRRKKKY